MFPISQWRYKNYSTVLSFRFPIFSVFSAVADSKGAVGRPPIGSHFCQKAAFFRVKAYISLCAFEMNEDGADKLSSAPPSSKFLDPPLIFSVLYSSVLCACLIVCFCI